MSRARAVAEWERERRAVLAAYGTPQVLQVVSVHERRSLWKTILVVGAVAGAGWGLVQLLSPTQPRQVSSPEDPGGEDPDQREAPAASPGPADATSDLARRVEQLERRIGAGREPEESGAAPALPSVPARSVE